MVLYSAPHVLYCEENILSQPVCLLFLIMTDRFSLFLPLPFSCGQEEPTYSALWGDNKAFNEVIISPAMLNEHMPHMVMEGLNKVCFLNLHACIISRGGVFEIVQKRFFNFVLDFQHWVTDYTGDAYVGIGSNNERK